MHGAMSSEDKTRFTALIVLGGFVAAVMFHYAMGMYLHRGYPANTFLFDPRDAGNDFFNIFAPVVRGTPYASPLSVYFPFTFAPLWLLRAVPAPLVFGLLLILLLVMSLGWLHHHIPRLTPFERPIAVGSLGLLSYPVLFCLDRGNVEILVFAFLCGFLWQLQRERWLVAALLLAAATAMKAYPGVFVVLLLARRQFRAAFAYGLLTIGLTIGSAALFPGGVRGSFAQLGQNLTQFNAGYIIGNAGLPFNSSYFGLLKIANLGLHIVPAESVGRFLLPYAVVCLLAFAALTALLVFRGGKLWQHVALLTFVMILFPQVSFDYKLLHLLLPLGLFLATPPARHDRRYALLLGLLLVPKAYVWLGADANVGVLVNPLLMTILGGALLIECARARTEQGA